MKEKMRGSVSKLYSTPRRFDVTTIMVVTAAYAVLINVLRLFSVPSLEIVLFAGFVTLVGVGQAVLFRGKRPRLASILIGIVCGGLYCFVMPHWGIPFTVSRMMIPEVWLMAGILGTIGGTITGYLSGASVGGVFCFSEYICGQLKRTNKKDIG